MARSLENKQNVQAPDSDYPYGRIKDDDGTGNGTPVNEQVYGDFHQFFAKLLSASGISPNELSENAYSGFQYFQALLEVISKRVGKASTSEDVDFSSDNLNEFLYPGNYVVTTAFSNKPSGLTGDGLLIVIGHGNNLVQRLTQISHGAEWVRYYTGSWSAWSLARLAKQTVEIGDWNMDSDSQKVLTPSVWNIDQKKIRHLSGIIRDDDDEDRYVINSGDTTSNPPVYFLALLGVGGGNSIYIERLAGSVFDSTNFNATSYNRGWLVIEYEV